jgi:nucleoid-associated protein YgaU
MVSMGTMASLGAAGLGGGLQKLRITYERHQGGPGGPIVALFNPQEISRSRTVSWEQENVLTESSAPSGSEMLQRFQSVSPRTLSMELFFDTYAEGRNVTRHTKQVGRLAKIDSELHRPPVCHLDWGRFHVFDGVITQIDERFSLFLPDGTPVRATLDCTFVECRRALELHSSDVVKSRVVKRHDTLQSIAAEEYNDPSLWRNIAKANRIVNPRAIPPGTVLTIPKLRS